jgi:3-oxoacyl-[acyl-carrier-protein] synthase II
MAIVSACATGGHCVGEASEMIRRGVAAAMLAGGADASDSPLAFAYFLPLRALADDPECPARACKPFDVRRKGTPIAEGAVVLVLGSEEHARWRGARVYAEVAGYGAANDAFHVVGREPRARGARRAMQMALRKVGLRPEEVDYVNTHGTGTPMNDAAETLALKDVFGDHASRLTISSTKSMTGHMMGAAGTIEAMVCALACGRGLVPPTINLEQPDPACDLDYTPLVARSLPVRVALSNSMGIGGYSACVAMRRY